MKVEDERDDEKKVRLLKQFWLKTKKYTKTILFL